MNIDINFRRNQLTRFHNYHKDVDAEVTMILQNLQWDRKHLTEGKPMVACQYDKGHRVPPDKLIEHENKCFLKRQGYTERDCLLPSPIEPDANTLVKLNGDNISEIIKNASYCQPSFMIGAGCSGHQPLTLERLQATYTTDERRAIHDAVVNQVPSCHDLSDLALLSSKDEAGTESKAKSKLEILAELRDMRRRRAKYRVPAKTRNYSDVLRDVITTQMELYTQAHNSMSPVHSIGEDSDSVSNSIAKNWTIEKKKFGHCDTPNRNDHYIVQRSNIKDTHKAQYSRQHKDYESKRRRQNESDHGYDSISGPSSTDRRRDHYDSKSNRKDDRYYSSKAHRESHRLHDWYDSRDKYREKQYERKRDSRTAHQSVNTPRDKTKDERYDRHTNRLRYEHDKYGNKNIVDVNKRRRHERREQVDTVTIKKEKDDYYDENNDTDSTDKTSHYYETNSGAKKIKLENEVYLKKKGTGAQDTESNALKASNEYRQSKKVHNTHINTYKDKRKYHEKSNDIQEQKGTDITIQKIKLERDPICEEPLNIDESGQGSRAADDHRHQVTNEQFRNRDDECTKDKIKEKEIAYKSH